MILPNDEECARLVKELEDDPGLTQWESDFLDSNRGRDRFSDAQKAVFARLKEKFEV